MHDPDPAAPQIVLFDGVCNLCNGLARFIAANDPAGRFTVLPLQSPRAQALLPPELRSAPSGPETIVLLAHGRAYVRSDAALHIALGLREPWPLLFGLILIPRETRDALYRWIARNRYDWFGRRDSCEL